MPKGTIELHERKIRLFELMDLKAALLVMFLLRCTRCTESLSSDWRYQRSIILSTFATLLLHLNQHRSTQREVVKYFPELKDGLVLVGQART